jgi:hypothetical protein
LHHFFSCMLCPFLSAICERSWSIYLLMEMKNVMCVIEQNRNNLFTYLCSKNCSREYCNWGSKSLIQTSHMFFRLNCIFNSAIRNKYFSIRTGQRSNIEPNG